MASFPQTNGFPQPGPGLYEVDRITILGVTLPLAKSPEGALELDVDKKKEPGSDFATYVGQGLDSSEIKITIRLWREPGGKDWWVEWEKIRDKLIAKKLSKRNAVTVYHPILHAEGVDSLIITRRTFPQQEKGLFYTVELSGRDPRRINIGSNSTKKVQQDKELKSRQGTAAAQAKGNATGPGVQQQGRTAPFGPPAP